MSGGAVAFLTKPFNEDELLNALAQSQLKSLETYPVDNKFDRDLI
jgi:FixJ family two-component response regulator